MKNETKTLADLFLNLKGSKNKNENWITIAEKCKKILRDSNNDRKIASKKLGVSSELIRSIVSLLDLPDEIQDLIKERKILLDAAQRINTIKIPDKEKRIKKQIEVAQMIAGLTSHEQREIIQYAKKFPNSSLRNFKKRVTTPRKIQNIHVVILALDDDSFNFLNNQAKKEKTSVEKYIQKIIKEKEK